MMANLTARFLGNPAGWDSVALQLWSVQRLWGGHIIGVVGTGMATVRRVGTGTHWEQRYEFALGREEVDALPRLLIAHDLLAIGLPERASLVPDEAETVLTLRKGRRAFTLTTWANDPHDARVSAVVAALCDLELRADGLTPLYDGPYQSGRETQA